MTDTQTEEAKSNLINGKQQRILIVEDNATHRQLIKDRLEGRYHLEVAPDREMALRSLHQPNDLVVLDLGLPYRIGQTAKMEEGFKILDVLQDQEGHKRPVVIAVSGGYLSKERVQKLHDLGVAKILPKPFSLITFQDTVDSFLNPSE